MLFGLQIRHLTLCGVCSPACMQQTRDLLLKNVSCSAGRRTGTRRGRSRRRRRRTCRRRRGSTRPAPRTSRPGRRRSTRRGRRRGRPPPCMGRPQRPPACTRRRVRGAGSGQGSGQPFWLMIRICEVFGGYKLPLPQHIRDAGGNPRHVLAAGCGLLQPTRWQSGLHRIASWGG